MSGPPQSVINKVLDDCDLLVGIFWTRIGTATAEYVSGAVEEIQRHIAAGKPAMIYFSEVPVKPSLLNEKQYKQLQKFKSYCQPKGLYESFDSVDNFRSKFRDHLQITVNKYFNKNNTADLRIESISIATDEELASILSNDEKTLLKAASLDNRGSIHRYSISAGTYIEVSRVHIIKEQTAREISRWDAALESLNINGYIKSVGYKGEMFKITDKGFRVADCIMDLDNLVSEA